LRDIKGVLDRGTQGTQEKQTQSKRAQVYEMFSKGETPMTVAITLDLPEPEVTKLYKESWNLKQIGELNRVYLETRGDLAPFLDLYKFAKAEGMNV